ncbi:MAG: DinB family protein [Chloroflexota bacterium]
MNNTILINLFEHNNWANLKIIQACSALSDKQLDAEPQSVTKGSIRQTLTHLVSSQHNYLSLLTLPVEARVRVTPTAAEWEESARTSGEGLLSLARGEKSLDTQLQTTDGFYVEPWVVMVQAINHATEHREQIKSMLTSLGVTPPDIDGWDFGEATKALVPMPK